MYYTYAHYRNDTQQIFYIGSGTAQYRRATLKSGRPKAWRDIVDTYGYHVEILAEWSDRQTAYDHEDFLIDTFRQLGHPLVNGQQSAEANARRSQTLKGRPGRSPSIETRKKLSDMNRGRQFHIHSDEQKQKISDAKKLYWARRRGEI